MKPFLKSIATSAVVLTVATVLVSTSLNFPAFAQATAPQAPMSGLLSETTIKALQEALNKQGIAVGVDGVLNEATRAAIRQYQSQHHLPVTGEPDQATLAKLGVATQQAGSGTESAPSAQASMMPGMMGQMMGSQMMRMMPQGMMGQGQMPMMMCPMVAAMMGSQSGSMPMTQGQMGRQGMGAMGSETGSQATGQGIGPGLLYGMPKRDAELSAEQVKSNLERTLAAHGNPRLKIGEMRPTEYGEVIAEIVTLEGSLVQKLAVDRRTGNIRQIN